MQVRLSNDYGNWYWNSGTGVTIRKDDREGVDVDIDNSPIRLALEQGILEIVNSENKVENKIITDIPSMPTMKEVVTESNSKEMKKTRKRAKKGAVNDK